MRNEHAFIQTYFHILFALRIAEFSIFFLHLTSFLCLPFFLLVLVLVCLLLLLPLHLLLSLLTSPLVFPFPLLPLPLISSFQKFFESKFWHGLDERAAHSSARAQNQRILCGKKLAARHGRQKSQNSANFSQPRACTFVLELKVKHLFEVTI